MGDRTSAEQPPEVGDGGGPEDDGGDEQDGAEGDEEGDLGGVEARRAGRARRAGARGGAHRAIMAAPPGAVALQ